VCSSMQIPTERYGLAALRREAWSRDGSVKTWELA
jgi:hypothetical protein